MKGLFGYSNFSIVKPKSSPPDPSATAGTTAATALSLTEEVWEDQNGKALAQIAINCSDTILIALDRYSNAAEVWKYLAETYQNLTWLAKSLAKTRLTDIQYTDGTDMPEHIDTLNVRLAECRSIGITIEDAEFCRIITDSLPLSWDNVIALLASNITPGDLGDKVCLEDARRCAHGLYQKLPNQALYSANHTGPRQPNPKNNLICSNCKKTRHLVVECFHKGGRKAGQWPEWYTGKREDALSKEKANLAVTDINCLDSEQFE